MSLREGSNHVFVSGIHDSVSLEFWKPITRMVIGTWDLRPRAYSTSPKKWSENLRFPAFNLSLEAAEGIHMHYGDPIPNDGKFRAGLHEWADGGFAAPLCFRPVNAIVFPEDDVFALERTVASEALVPICLYDYQDDNADRQIVRIPLRGRIARENDLDEFMSTMSVFVYATGGTPEENAASLAQARFEQQRLYYRTGGAPTVQSDRKYLDECKDNEWWSKLPLTLLGNADTNLAWSERVEAPPSFDIRRGFLQVGDKRILGDDLCGAVRVPRKSEDRGHPEVGLFFHTGVTGARISRFASRFLGPELDQTTDLIVFRPNASRSRLELVE